VTPALATALGSILVAALAGWAIPALGMRMLMPSLEASQRKVRNYRGIEVSAGLGIVWALWGVIILVASLKELYLSGVFGMYALGPSLWWAVPAFLVVLAFSFGLVDDVFGDSAAKGFRGHLKAIAKGRLTTGGLKLLGIGIAAALVAFPGRSAAALTADAFDAVWIASWVLATLTIALAANFVNLTDLRPGRSLKSYTTLIVLALPAVAWSAARTQEGSGGLATGTTVAVTAILALGPVFAVWRYDLGERAMLGDAGANAMGALAGYLLAVSLPLWGLAIAATVLLALNLASEKISFSKVIESNRALRWIDRLGTRPDAREHTDVGAAPADGYADEKDSGTGKDGAI
jgi:hypothetical protein